MPKIKIHRRGAKSAEEKIQMSKIQEAEVRRQNVLAC
jgi:hypothetical protein